MRFIIVCLSLGVLCKGYVPKTERTLQENDPKREAELSQLLHLLQRIVPASSIAVPKASPKTSKEDLYLEPPMTDPRSFGLDELYKFPASNMMLEIIEHKFTSPEPVYTRMMQDLPVKDSEVYTEYLLAMDSKWNASMILFKDDLNALPELFTKMATKFVANLRFSCPSAFFDSLYVHRSMVELKEVLASDDDAMLLAFYNEMRAFFTDLPEDTVRAVAAEGMVRLGWFVNEEMIEYLFGEAFRDVAVFSWRFWSEIYSYLNSNMVTILPYPNTALPTYRPISGIFWSAWDKSKISCETGQEVLVRYLGIIETFRKRYHQITIDEVRSKVLSFVADKALNYSYDVSTFDETVLMTRIEASINDIIAFHEEQETYLRADLDKDIPDMIPLYEFFKSFEDEPGFAWGMLTKLGLDTIPFRRRTSFSDVPKVSGQATRGRCLHFSGTEPIEQEPAMPVQTYDMPIVP